MGIMNCDYPVDSRHHNYTYLDISGSSAQQSAANKQKRSKNSCSSTSLQDCVSVSNQVFPMIDHADNNSKVVEQNGAADLNKLPPQLEKESLTKDPECGNRLKFKNKKKVFKLMFQIVLQSFTLTFLAEWGDRSQITTIALAARDNMYGVALGGLIGHSLCTGLAVLGGRFVAQKISVKTVTIAGGVVFILFAVMTLLLDTTEDTKASF